ncbi:hypothetical protein HCX48_09505 [Rhodocyclus tenuis]|uniref:Uncharacterized protein n=2 Tax=Rhodocyclus TaxID=1064 RepID=A0A6L5JYI5_RHOTE|nr:hypothetical protein [Rhodocyclus gracilis]MQY52111.1 hypothetical protein [Rhodocyclus gracilis]NJA89455.1 hypothetical protein [Rhodocyclus gracilis]
MSTESAALKRQYIEDNEAASARGDIPRLIAAAAVAAGIIDTASLTAIDASLVKIDGRGEVTNAREVVEELRRRRPDLFKKSAKEMSDADYEEARRRLSGIGRSSFLI